VKEEMVLIEVVNNRKVLYYVKIVNVDFSKNIVMIDSSIRSDGLDLIDIYVRENDRVLLKYFVTCMNSNKTCDIEIEEMVEDG